MGSPIIQRHAQGSAAALAAVDQSPSTLYIQSTGAFRFARVTHFEWMPLATYTALAEKHPRTLYIITTATPGRGSAHRWPPAAATATAFYLGDALVTIPTPPT